MNYYEIFDLRNAIDKEIETAVTRSIYSDTDSIKLLEKHHLNSMYGARVIENYNHFIVLHVDKRPLLIRKDAIIGIKKTSDGTAGILTMSSYMEYIDETYEEVVRKLFK